MTQPVDWKPRELEILQLLAQGLSNAEIGLRLHLAPDTVRRYNKGLIEKLGVGNRVQAASRAGELGLLGDKSAPASSIGAASQRARAPVRAPVRYAVNGGVHLAYQVVGDGPVDLLFIHGFISHLEAGWENPEFARFFEQLGQYARVILFDKRGVGLSDRNQGAPTLEETVSDARCVLAAAGSQRAFVLGTSEGGAAAVLLASLHPALVRGLILYAAMPIVVQVDGEPDWASPPERYGRWLAQMQQAWGGPWNVERFAPSRAQDETFRDWWARTLRAASSPASVEAVISLVSQVDIRALLPQVRTRALVVHKTSDQMARVEAGRYLAAQLPNARFIELPGADHIYFVDSEALLAAIGTFLAAESADRPVDTRLGIVLTALGADAASGAALEVLAHSGARRSQSAAWGVAAVFDGPSAAVDCARRLLGLPEGARLRVGLHVGECRAQTSEPLAPVLAAARQSAEQAAPGEIVVSRTLHDILAGSGLVMVERSLPAARRAHALRAYTLQ